MRELAEKFTQAFGPSGNEKEIRDIIKKEIKNYVDEIYVDNLGSLIAHKKGKGKKLLFAAHMDEIGIIVTHIDEKGFIRFAPVGGVYPIISLGQRIQFGNGQKGVIGVEFKDIPRDKIPPLSKMFIDIGASSKKDVEKTVNVGDMACFTHEFVDLGKKWVSKAMDDRLCCAALVKAIKSIKKTVNDLYFVFTVQEEVGLRGGKTSTYSVDPDLAIAVDVTGTGDTPKGFTMDVALGKGPALKIMDFSIVVTEKVKTFMKKVADKNKIPVQMEILQFGGTDAGAMQMTKGGISSGCISIPTRYIHTPGETVDKDDVEKTVKWIVSLSETDISKEGFGNKK